MTSQERHGSFASGWTEGRAMGGIASVVRSQYVGTWGRKALKRARWAKGDPFGGRRVVRRCPINIDQGEGEVN